jgi:hypothetical protein
MNEEAVLYTHTKAFYRALKAQDFDSLRKLCANVFSRCSNNHRRHRSDLEAREHEELRRYNSFAAAQRLDLSLGNLHFGVAAWLCRVHRGSNAAEMQ